MFSAIERLMENDAAEVDRSVFTSGDWAPHLSAVADVCRRAYEQGDPHAERSVQSLLRSIYRLELFPARWGERNPEGSAFLLSVRNLIEHSFVRALDARIGPLEPHLPTRGAEVNADWLYEKLLRHPAYAHPLYTTVLPKHCSRRDLEYFLIQESTIDDSTDDFLALVQVAARGAAKIEIARNYWDEMGNGDPVRLHSRLFHDMLDMLGATVTTDRLATEALVCGNLQAMLALKRRYFGLAVGYFAATEFMAVSRFKGVREAWRRVGLGDGSAYHVLHITVDVDHAAGWAREVLVPTMAESPHACADVVRGALFRLETSNAYLDVVLKNIQAGNPSLVAVAPLQAVGSP
jgi:hypothetical protein